MCTESEASANDVMCGTINTILSFNLTLSALYDIQLSKREMEVVMMGLPSDVVVNNGSLLSFDAFVFEMSPLCRCCGLIVCLGSNDLHDPIYPLFLLHLSGIPPSTSILV